MNNSIEGEKEMEFTFDDICDRTCLKKNNILLEDILDKIKNGSEKELKLPFEHDNYDITYAPVGNYPKEPLIIICGKTTSGDSSDKFKDQLMKTGDLYSSCVKSIYSNMKDNLFIYLDKIGLFEYLSGKLEYWNISDYKTKWDEIFTEPTESPKSGIQVTQAFNCAILNKDRKKRSSQPPKRIFKQVQQEYGCFFKHFRISDKLKLIIFLDTPGSRSSFHQIDFWNKYYADNYDFKVISITHPSAQNSIIYNNLDNLDKIINNKKANAILLFEKAKQTIKSLQ